MKYWIVQEFKTNASIIQSTNVTSAGHQVNFIRIFKNSLTVNIPVSIGPTNEIIPIDFSRIPKDEILGARRAEIDPGLPDNVKSIFVSVSNELPERRKLKGQGKFIGIHVNTPVRFKFMPYFCHFFNKLNKTEFAARVQPFARNFVIKKVFPSAISREIVKNKDIDSL